MEVKVKGRVIKVLQEEKGVSTAGKNWFKSGFVIETEDQYPKKIALTVMSENLMPVVRTLTIGEQVTAHINLDSREHQDKWFTNVTAWKIDRAEAKVVAIVEQPTIKVTDEDLPF